MVRSSQLCEEKKKRIGAEKKLGCRALALTPTGLRPRR